MEYFAIKDWIAFVSSLGTFLSSIFVLITLFELRTQRKQSYIPELIIPDVCFDYNNEFSRYIDIWKMDDGNALSLKVYNVGLGVAKDVNFEWKYDVNSMIEKFYQLSNPDKGEMNIDKKNDLICCKDGSFPLRDTQHINFLLPYSNSNSNSNSADLDLSISYTYISYIIYKNTQIKEIFDLKEFDGMLCPLNLIVKYKDIGGYDITKKFSVNIKFFVNSINLGVKHSDKIIKMRGRVYVSEL